MRVPSRMPVPPSGRVRSRWFALACGLLALGVVAPLILPELRLNPVHNRLIDLHVYREAGVSLRTGRDVYGYYTPTPTLLPFTYPPVAAFLAVPLSLLGFHVLGVVWTCLTLALVWWTIRRAFAAALPALGAWRPMATAVVFVGCVWLLPVRDTIMFGQVNMVLLVLVLLDCTTPVPRWPRGVLVGLAAAVKLTPAVFVVYLLVSGRRRAGLTALATFGGLAVLAWVVSPHTSADFWFHAVRNTDRVRANDFTSNQSVRGWLLRAHVGAWTMPLYLLMAAALGVVGFTRAGRASRRGDELAGVAVVGLLAVLLSPVAWIHHLCWVVLVLGVLATRAALRRRPRDLALFGAVAVFFILRVPWYGASAIKVGLAPAPLWRLVEDGFGLAAAALVLFLPIPRAAVEPDGPASQVPAPLEPLPIVSVRSGGT